MNETIYKILFIIFALTIGIIRFPHRMKYVKKKKGLSRVSKTDNWTFMLAYAGILAIPLIHIFTNLFDGFRMGLPDRIRLIGPIVATMGLILLQRVHKVLDYCWAPFSEITEGHKLVTAGPYKYVRHPMYAAFYLIILGSWLALSNWLVGIAGFLSWSIFCGVRIKTEEGMMIQKFGQEYEEYKKRTGYLLPKVGR